MIQGLKWVRSWTRNHRRVTGQRGLSSGQWERAQGHEVHLSRLPQLQKPREPATARTGVGFWRGDLQCEVLPRALPVTQRPRGSCRGLCRVTWPCKLHLRLPSCSPHQAGGAGQQPEQRPMFPSVGCSPGTSLLGEQLQHQCTLYELYTILHSEQELPVVPP